MRWNDFVKYNLIRTNFLNKFVSKKFKAEDNLSPLFLNMYLLPLFLNMYQKSGSIFQAWIDTKEYNLNAHGYSVEPIKPEIVYQVNDYIDNWWYKKDILKMLEELFPEMIASGYDVKNLEKDVPNFSPLSIEEFYKITKGEWYVGCDLDLDLEHMIPYVKENELVYKYIKEISDYFKFRYDNYDLRVLCEYCSVSFGYHNSRAERYRKTGELEFDFPREVYKYDINAMIEEYLKIEDLSETRLINIRGTNGSGKSTMVNSIYLDSIEGGFAESLTMSVVDRRGENRVRAYDVLKDKKIILLGGYNTPRNSKGADRLGDLTEICIMIIKAVSMYPGWTIIVESAPMSTSFWGYAILFGILQKKGLDVHIIHLFMYDWEFAINNVKARLERKEGQKEPQYQGILNKRFTLFRNHFRFASILGSDSMHVMFPDTLEKDKMWLDIDRVMREDTGRGILLKHSTKM